jgi:hypothetical protein
MLLTKQEHLEEAERILSKAKELADDRSTPYQRLQVFLKFAEIHTLIAAAQDESPRSFELAELAGVPVVILS